jgi:putative selenium metabolism protein SsnA
LSRIIITNGMIYTGNEVIPHGTVLMEEETVTHICHSDQRESFARCADDVIIDADGRLITPGLINAHTHIYSALARGIALKDAPPANFVQILERLWWRLDNGLTLSDITLSTHLHALDCLHHGVTTLFDHHASQRVITDSLSTIATTLEQHGLRSCLCFEVSDRESAEAARRGIEENRQFFDRCNKEQSSHLRAKFGLHASMTLSAETLGACRQAIGNQTGGFHVHVAEDRADQENAMLHYGKPVIRRLADAGILNEETLCVHGVHLSDEEVEILAKSGAWLVHCPESNMNNAVGAADLSRYQNGGVNLALGTDGFTTDMFRETLAAHLLQNHDRQHPGAGYDVVPDLLFKANAALATQTFGLPLGTLQEKTPADLVVWEYRPPTPLNETNLYGHILFGLVGAQAREVVVAGRHLLHEGVALTCDEKAIAAECAEAAENLWERF